MSRTGGAAFIMLTIIAMTAGRSRAADWSGTLGSSLNAAYVVNPRMLPGNDVSDETGQLEVAGAAIAQTERGKLVLAPRFALVRYDHGTDLNRDEGSLAIDYQESLERGQWTFDGTASTDTTVTSELGTTGITYVNRRHNAGVAALGYTYFSSERLSWQMQVSGQITRYEDAEQFGLTNYNYGSLQFGPSWSFSERVQGLLTLEADRLHPQTGAQQTNYGVAVQLRRRFSERYSWHLSGGATRVDYGSTGSSGSSSSTSAQYEIGTTYKGERLQWDLSAKRAVLPIGLGLLAPQTAAALTLTADTSDHSTLTVSINGVRTDAVTVGAIAVYSGATWGVAQIQWRHHFTTHWSLAVSYQQSRARDLNVTEWANGKQAQIAVSWDSGRL
ncbi:MAG: hypothetical protein JO184_11650 [Gammaproteobacteria bacterium]|nr:hypothetical protein [Gammaproteobacteria bacterium]